jgi:hypothetical protein
MIAKITHCDERTFWYYKCIGSEFEIIDDFKDCITIKDAENRYRFIRKSDCEIKA